MSSGTPTDPRAANQGANQLGAAITQGGGAVNPRRTMLSRRYSYFKGTCYDGRAHNWDGDPIIDAEIGRGQNIPPGFTDYSGSTAPLSTRRPSAPYYLGRVVVKRFTGLLFSQRRHPRVRVLGDALTEDWLSGAIESGRLWAQMIPARDFGGSMGAVGLGFEFADGLPVFEVFDPRWTTPKFTNRLTRELENISVCWPYREWLRDPDTGAFVEIELWACRVIDAQADMMWEGIPPGDDGGEPDWRRALKNRQPTRTVEHGFGFCPVEWIQNTDTADEIDGEPDCHGAFDLIEEVDALNSQGSRGIKANCDPTLVVTTADQIDNLRKGSDSFIRLNPGETAQYLELNGSGPKTAIEQADRLEAKALRIVRCVIEESRNFAAKTATEVTKDYSAMHEQADVLREQYAERGVKRLLGKLIRAARMVDGSTAMVDGVVTRTVLRIPPRVEEEEQPDGTTKTKIIERKLGKGGEISFQWPPYETPTMADALAATQAANQAKSGGLVDPLHASRFVASTFQVEDPKAMLADMARQAQAAEDAETQRMMRSQAPAEAAPGATFTQFEVDAGVVTVNEIRASKGLPPLQLDGDLSVPQFRQKYAQTFAKATMSANETGAEKILGVEDAETPPPNARPNGAA